MVEASDDVVELSVGNDKRRFMLNVWFHNKVVGGGMKNVTENSW